jgi:hypothetical protein
MHKDDFTLHLVENESVWIHVKVCRMRLLALIAAIVCLLGGIQHHRLEYAGKLFYQCFKPKNQNRYFSFFFQRNFQLNIIKNVMEYI